MPDVSLPPLSILDLALVSQGESVRAGLDASVELARKAETWGYRRIWYAEHHNMRAIASSATSVLIGHVAAHTERITLGAGGIMLPNHSPLQVAEQFGTLAELFPGRIELGLGRAPGTDQTTFRALRRDPGASETFPQDVQELQGFLGEHSLVPGVDAYPGKGTNVPLYVLGSSLYGAQVAAILGLPYAFASHFAPEQLERAVEMYREKFRPSAQLAEPLVLAGVNVVAADDIATADELMRVARLDRVKRFLSRGGHELTDEEAALAIDMPQGRQILDMMRYTAVGTPDVVEDYLTEFAARVGIDELVVASPVVARGAWYRSFELLAGRAAAVAV
ncbi:putative luciferase-like protein [Pseudonocardia sulfidoxydans NBRC 16205]|uniref:Putative luciferase-like protein n=1 Tax=Pseudonocardia sulfidoxydans NBRC 16205 TaxID=1223511 RepID=A0A511DEL1_9PSEU|nr:LLM class flavin-dependent oxidoreductase [Pseudonocardia sulfidoxydans]GEL23216.1 putative luciferase-like protein [Pseudonocardia sulfidoxydans NBRC 16205]